MKWTWDKIEREWLGRSHVAVSREVVVDAFNRVQDLLGTDWMLRVKPDPRSWGSMPTLGIVSTGQCLVSLEGVPSSKRLIEKIRNGSESAFAEALALHLIRLGGTGVVTEIEPRILPQKSRPDFRVQGPNGRWVYCEVKQPKLSKEEKRVHYILRQITRAVTTIEKSFSVEVFLRRIPTNEEVDNILERLPDFCVKEGIRREELGSLGFLLLNRDPPGEVCFRDHEGELVTPRRIEVCRIAGPECSHHRHILARLAFSDERAQSFLERAASQLPRDAPGLIMLNISGTERVIKSWECLLRRCLAPDLYTNVSATCLFGSHFEHTSAGEAWIPWARLVINEHAKTEIPEWFSKTLLRNEFREC